jgi:hypothetical protein
MRRLHYQTLRHLNALHLLLLAPSDAVSVLLFRLDPYFVIQLHNVLLFQVHWNLALELLH